MQHIKKGSKLLIEGFPSVNAYINKDNVACCNFKCHAKSIEFIGSPQSKDENMPIADNEAVLKSEVPW